MEPAISRLDTNYQDSAEGQGIRSHLRTLSCEATADLFLIAMINKSNCRLNIKRSAQECLIEALRSKYLRIFNRST